MLLSHSQLKIIKTIVNNDGDGNGSIYGGITKINMSKVSVSIIINTLGLRKSTLKVTFPNHVINHTCPQVIYKNFKLITTDTENMNNLGFE